MSNSSLSTQSSNDKQQALLRILKATTKLSAQATFYAADLGAILLIPGAIIPKFKTPNRTIGVFFTRQATQTST